MGWFSVPLTTLSRTSDGEEDTGQEQQGFRSSVHPSLPLLATTILILSIAHLSSAERKTSDPLLLRPLVTVRV